MSDYAREIYEDNRDDWNEKCRLILEERNISGITVQDIEDYFFDDGFTPEETIDEMEVYWGIEEDE